jgi:hypothetical protein
VIDASNVVALRDPRQWRLLAEHIRNVADSVNDHVRRRRMLDVADKYERVGKFIERQRLDLLKPPVAPFNPRTHKVGARRHPLVRPGSATRRI